MTEQLSPFVFKKFSLGHLEIQKEITLKFRKATIVDTQRFKEEFGNNYLEKQMQDPVTVVETIAGFLTKDSIKEILKINFVDIDKETGKEVKANIPFNKKFMMLFPVGEDKWIYELFFSILGYTKEQVDLVMGIADKAIEKEKKRQKNIA